MRRPRLIRRTAAAAATSIAMLSAVLPSGLVRATPALAAQSSNEQMVSVTVTPRDLSAPAWEFEIVFNTHVQSIEDDLMQAAALVDAAGQRHAPLAWRGDGPGGHHRKGVLVFAPLQPRPASIELQIRRAGEPAARGFRWQLP